VSHVQVSIRGVAYELGEHEASYRDALRFEGKVTQYQMLDDPAVWGWGRFFRSRRSRAELAVASARRSLAMAGCTGRDIDAVILCAAEFPANVACHASYCRAVLEELELGHAFVIGVTLGRCNTTLSAIQLAHSLVASRAYGNVLVAASDRVVDEEDRFQSFALFSDGAASCIVTSQPGGDHAIVATASALDPPAMDSAGGVSGRLGRTAIDAVTRQSGVSPHEISMVLPPNLFTPIVKMSERQSGFRPDQLYMRNIAERGHCFSADPLVNLVDCQSANGSQAGDYILLTSSVPGSRMSILTEVLRAAATRSSHEESSHA
jgi:3-oxoacyl-[acyl-carrier-protein] synthase III